MLLLDRQTETERDGLVCSRYGHLYVRVGKSARIIIARKRFLVKTNGQKITPMTLDTQYIHRLVYLEKKL